MYVCVCVGGCVCVCFVWASACMCVHVCVRGYKGCFGELAEALIVWSISTSQLDDLISFYIKKCLLLVNHIWMCFSHHLGYFHRCSDMFIFPGVKLASSLHSPMVGTRNKRLGIEQEREQNIERARGEETMRSFENKPGKREGRKEKAEIEKKEWRKEQKKERKSKERD